MKKKYKLWNVYFNVNNIASMSEPIFNSHINNNLKDEYCETGIKELKEANIFINGKNYSCTNYWDSDYNIGITKETQQTYNEFEKEVKELYDAFLSSIGG